jgi:hypothetical protein
MRPPLRALRELLSDLRLPSEEPSELRAEQCLESLYDERCACGGHLGEQEQAALEAERRRWTSAHLDRPAAS